MCLYITFNIIINELSAPFKGQLKNLNIGNYTRNESFQVQGFQIKGPTTSYIILQGRQFVYHIVIQFRK